MNATAVLAALQNNQRALLTIVLLELTGYLFPPPAILRDGDSFDYVIVGGGTAGSVIATRLVQQKYNVLLIEAGEDAPYESTLPALFPYVANSHVDWNYTTEPDDYTYQGQVDKVTKLGLGKMLGGSSESNYMIYYAGHRQDFDKWYKITKDRIWKWENVLPYFMKSENVSDSAIRNSNLSDLYGSKGYIGVTRDQSPFTDELLKGFEQDGRLIFDNIEGSSISYTKALLTIKDGLRQGAGTRYLSHISESRYIATAKNTLATKIIFDDNKKAVGVEVITDEGEIITIGVRKEVIVTAGAIKSPQLLLLSGIGPEKELEDFNITCISDLPVGKNLQDHVGVFLTHKTNKPIVKQKVNPGLYPVGIVQGYARLNSSKHHKLRPDYGVVANYINDLEFLFYYCAAIQGFPYRTCNKLYEEADNNQVLISLVYDIYAESLGQVVLRSTDPKDSPKVYIDSFGFDRDLDLLVDYMNDYLKVEKTKAFKSLGVERIELTTPKCDAFKKWSRKYNRCCVLNMMVSMRSYAGTCAMSSVVDSRLRVKGVTGLRVADASVMPVIVMGLTYNTVVMIGEKAADIIIEDAGPEYNSMKHKKIRKDQIKNMPN